MRFGTSLFQFDHNLLIFFYFSGTAFRKYESWWDEQERTKVSKGIENENPNPNPKAPDINQLLVPRDNFEFNQNAISLGLRAQIPKLPSFRRIRKAPSPTPDEDSRKSDQEDMVRGSDDEKELPESTSYSRSKEQPQPARVQRRKGSTSSFFTSSSEDDSSSDTDELSDSSLSDVVDADLPKAKVDDRQIYSDSSEDEEAIKTPNLPVVKNKTIYSSDSEEEGEIKRTPLKVHLRKSPSKTPEGRATPIPTDRESTLSPKPPRTPGRESPETKDTKKPVFDLERVYSDSEEEKEYQEKRRRNTEYMEQIEREFQEEQERKRREEAETRANEVNHVPDRAPSPRAPSPREPDTPTISLPPPTPGATFSSSTDPLAKYAEKKTHKVKNRAVEEVEEFDEPKAFVIQKDLNGIMREPPQVKTSPESESSQPAFFLDHCYSLPPSASPSSSEHGQNEKKKNFSHDHGYTSDNKKPVGRPRKDPTQTNRSKYQIKKAQKAAEAAAAMSFSFDQLTRVPAAYR